MEVDKALFVGENDSPLLLGASTFSSSTGATATARLTKMPSVAAGRLPVSRRCFNRPSQQPGVVEHFF